MNMPGAKAEGKSEKYYKYAFNAAKSNFAEVAYLLYIKCFKLAGDISKFNGNNINSSYFKSIDPHNYQAILDILAANNVIVINNSYAAKRFSKSFILHHDIIYSINDSKYKFNYNSTLIDLSSYQHLYKMFQPFPSIYVDQTRSDNVLREEKFNKNKREYKKTYEDKEMEKTNYQMLTYDEKSLIEYCAGDELMEYYYRQKLKDLIIMLKPYGIKVETANTVNVAPVSVVKNEEISPQVKAAIIAAISAYYFTNENKSTCDFIVKKIKRINRY